MSKGQILLLPDNAIAAPAVILRPMLATQSMKANTSFIGGMPCLPDIYDWPTYGPEDTAYHFFAQIDLSALPRELLVSGKSWPMPDFPKFGFLLVFLPLQGDMIDICPPVILFYEDLRHCPALPPPHDVPKLREDDFVDLDAVSECRQMFRQQALSFIPCMSVRPLMPYSDEIAVPATSHLHDAVREAHPKVVLRKPQPGADKAIFLAERSNEHLNLARLPTYLQNASGASDAANHSISKWSDVFEFSRHFLIALIDEALRVGRGKVSAGIGGLKMKKAVDGFEALKSQIIDVTLDEDATVPELIPAHLGTFHRFMSKLHRGINLASAELLDVDAIRWMEIAKEQSRLMTLPETIEFAQFLQRIDTLANAKKTARLRFLNGASGVTVKHGKLRQAAVKAWSVVRNNAQQQYIGPTLENGAEPVTEASIRWQAKVATQTQSDDTTLFGGSHLQPLQMFGYGELVQTAEYDNRDKVMLLRLGNQFGTGIDFGDVAIQIWISHGDLKHKRFDRIEWTVETT